MFFVICLLCTFVFSYKRPVRIILDTDIGQDIDDSWALALLLNAPESVKIELVLTAARNTEGRAQIACKYLESVGRTDIDVGIGKKYSDFVGDLYGWAKNYKLESYPGNLYRDGIKQMAAILETSAEDDPVWIVEIAPMTNIKALIDHYPEAAKRVERIVGLSGSLTRGTREYNPSEDVPACIATYEYEWKNLMHWANQDIAWEAWVDHDYNNDYPKLMEHNNTKYPVLNTLLENYCYWADVGGWKWNCYRQSSVLHDGVAAFFAVVAPDYEKWNLVTEELPVYCNATGFTIEDSTRPVNSVEGRYWKQGALGGWSDWVVEILTRDPEEVQRIRDMVGA